MKIIENLSRFTILTNPNNLYCFNDSFKVKDTYYDVLIINGTFTKQELENLTPNDSTKSKIFHIKKETVNEYCSNCNGRGSWEGHDQDCVIHKCDSCKGKGFKEIHFTKFIELEIKEPQIIVLDRKLNKSVAIELAKQILEKCNV